MTMAKNEYQLWYSLQLKHKQKKTDRVKILPRVYKVAINILFIKKY